MIKNFDSQVLEFDIPKQRLIYIRNCYVKSNNLISDYEVTTLPTMYKSWTKKQRNHLKFKKINRWFKVSNQVDEFSGERQLLIFDTWGVSSYYHLLIDHIIPLWITRKWAIENLGIFHENPTYWRVSKNKWKHDLDKIQEIFAYFLGNGFEEKVFGNFRDVVCGYFYNWRPFVVKDLDASHASIYSKYLESFREAFCVFSRPNNKFVLVPTRLTREHSFVNEFVSKYQRVITFKVVDMGSLSIREQVELSGQASVIFGSEGAAFANSVFMQPKTLVIPVSNEPSRFMWHKSLADCIGLNFFGVVVDKFGRPLIDEQTVLELIQKYV